MRDRAGEEELPYRRWDWASLERSDLDAARKRSAPSSMRFQGHSWRRTVEPGSIHTPYPGCVLNTDFIAGQ